MNTTYSDKLKPQFQSIGVQPTKVDLSAEKGALDFVATKLKQEQQTLQNIAQDQAQIEFNRASAELIKQYDTDYVGLGNALKQLQDENYAKYFEKDPELATNLYRQQDIVRLRAVDDAHNNFIKKNNDLAKQNAQLMLDSIEASAPDDYARYLENLTLPAEQRDNDIINRWQNSLAERDTILNRKDLDGNYIFSDSVRNNKAAGQKYMQHGAYTYIDRFATNNDPDGLQKYYQQHILAPERYMRETGLDRDSYDKVRSYAEKILNKMEVETKGLLFDQSVKDALKLETEFAPEKLQKLREGGIINKKTLDTIENAQVKFSEIDPSKPEIPTTMIELLDIANRWDMQPDDKTEEARQETLLQSAALLNSIADFGKQYGMSEKNVEKAKQMAVMKATNQAYGDMLYNFGIVTQSFGNSIEDVAGKLEKIRNGKHIWNSSERRKLTDLNNLLSETEEESRQALLVGDTQKYNQIQKELPKKVAKIKYSDFISDSDWAAWETDPLYPISLGNGEIVLIKGFSSDGDIIVLEE